MADAMKDVRRCERFQKQNIETDLFAREMIKYLNSTVAAINIVLCLIGQLESVRIECNDRSVTHLSLYQWERNRTELARTMVS